MASFDEAPPGNPKVGEKIFKTKCAQCHTVEKGAGHKQGLSLFYFDLICIDQISQNLCTDSTIYFV